MKTDFELENLSANQTDKSITGTIRIIGAESRCDPYVAINTNYGTLYIKDKDLKRFATNILKSLNS